MTMKFGIHFGALLPPIKEQVEKQGAIIHEEDAERLQKIANAITMLAIHDIIPDSSAHKARMKLLKKISEVIEVDNQNEPEVNPEHEKLAGEQAEIEERVTGDA